MSTEVTPSTLQVTTAWERPLVGVDGAETALVVTIAATAGADPMQRTPVDVAFVLDHSGSMAGQKLDLVKEAVDVALDHLAAKDRVSLIVFDSEVGTLHKLREADAGTKATIRRRLNRVEAGSSTYLSGGWFAGCQELAEHQSKDDPRPRRALLLTDGLANEGITEPHALTKHATELRLRGITTTAIGVGSGFDEMLLGGMAEAGGGTFQYIAQPSELSAFFENEIGNLLAITAIRPTLRLTLPDGIHAHLVNAFPRHREGKTITIDLRDLSVGDEVRLVFDTSVAPGAEGSSMAPTFELRWTDAISNQRSRIQGEAESIVRVAAEDAADVLVDDDVAAIVALERAAKAQRKAVELDRAGRFEESRSAFAVAHNVMAAAPATPEIELERRLTQSLANAPLIALREEVRKERIFSNLRRSRGTRPDPRQGDRLD
ncbi:MAG TPA: VWA domain-containing protein [Thermomicrobiales bacterium]|nr:VWA domain-containing protein [Thermomicrobiales bacterium]